MNSAYPVMGSPCRVGTVTLRNRVVMAGHGSRFVEWHEHGLSQRQADYLAERAKGGVGLIIQGSGIVHPTGMTFPGINQVWNDSMLESYRLVADAVHEHGAHIFGQLSHLGRQGHSWTSHRELWAPSAVADPASRIVPHAMTHSEIEEVTASYVAAAKRYVAAGFDGLEVYMAHGYLLASFISPFSNKRDDEYGGSLKNRCRLPLEVFQAVRDAVGDVPVGIRVTSDEFVVGGTVLDEAIEAVDLLLSQTQIDYVSVSVSNYASIETMIPDMSFPRKPFVENAAAIRKVARGVPVMTVGRIVTPENAEEILSTGTADLVCIVRPLIADPEWTNKALDGKRNRIRECISCNVGCRGGPHRGTPIACLVNPAVGYERTMGVGTLTTATHAKHVVVVGGGPGGLKAAETAALRGHRVTVVEKQVRTGGMVVTAAATMPYRAEFAGSVTWLLEECERLSVQIITGKEATPEFLTSLKAEIVVLATGARPGRPAVDGVDLPHVYSVPDAIHSEVKGHHVAVVDCGEADWKSLTTAECLAARGHRVTIVSPAPAAAEIDAFSKPTLLRRLAAAKVQILEHRSLVSIQERNLTLVHGWSKQSETLPEVDAVVLSWYGVANDELRLTLENAGFDVHLVGDCLAPRRAIDAIWDGYRLGSTL